MEDIEFRKTGLIVNVEGVMPNPTDVNEKMYVYGLKVGDIVYKCHYVTKEDMNIELGDYAMIEGILFEINFGFVSMGIVRVLDMALLKKKQLKEFCKDKIFIVDLKVKGEKLPYNIQNGFIIAKKQKRKCKQETKKYGIFNITGFDDRGVAQGTCIGLYSNQTSLLAGCIDTAGKYDIRKVDIRVVDFERQIDKSLIEFIKEL